eukprot:COSAG06_NODE_1679_length_8738_cov_49.835050_8_plen_175_part_00
MNAGCRPLQLVVIVMSPVGCHDRRQKVGRQGADTHLSVSISVGRRCPPPSTLRWVCLRTAMDDVEDFEDIEEPSSMSVVACRSLCLSLSLSACRSLRAAGQSSLTTTVWADFRRAGLVLCDQVRGVRRLRRAGELPEQGRDLYGERGGQPLRPVLHHEVSAPPRPFPCFAGEPR